jgi:hypothetical protein
MKDEMAMPMTRLILTLFPALALAACGTANQIVKVPAKLVGFAADAPDPKDFVKQSRPDELNYIPVGTKVSREPRKMTPAEFRAIEADLDAAKTRNEAAGAEAKVAGATPPPAPLKLPQ